MKNVILPLVALSAFSVTTPAHAGGIIERACLSADRSAASARLCGCIQSVADQVLAPSEQRKGAAFFADPHKSQETRQSDNASDAAFWQKWKAYGKKAARACG